MKIIKRTYWIMICSLGTFFCLGLDSSLLIRYILIVIIFIPPMVYECVSMAMESCFKKWISIVLFELSTELSYNDFSEIVIKLIPNLHGKTFWNIINDLDEIWEYVDEKFSELDREKVKKTFLYAIEHWDASFPVKPLRVNSALQMKISQLMLRHFESNKDVSNSYSYYRFANVVFAIPDICALIFINKKSMIAFCFIYFMLIFMCVFYKYYGERFKLSPILTVLHWILSLAVITASPITISAELFLTPLGFMAFLFSQLTLILTGIYITNLFWEKTSIEMLNKGSFISDSKLPEIIEVRIFKSVRYIWLWTAFFLIIICIVLMYTFIYTIQLDVGDYLYSFLLSISLYFGGGNSNYDSLEGLYFSSEIATSFFVNTLYLANIVRIIFEPKATKK